MWGAVEGSAMGRHHLPMESWDKALGDRKGFPPNGQAKDHVNYKVSWVLQPGDISRLLSEQAALEQCLGESVWALCLGAWNTGGGEEASFQ